MEDHGVVHGEVLGLDLLGIRRVLLAVKFEHLEGRRQGQLDLDVPGGDLDMPDETFTERALRFERIVEEHIGALAGVGDGVHEPIVVVPGVADSHAEEINRLSIGIIGLRRDELLVGRADVGAAVRDQHDTIDQAVVEARFRQLVGGDEAIVEVGRAVGLELVAASQEPSVVWALDGYCRENIARLAAPGDERHDVAVAKGAR